ncbi:MAG: hypothetical protein COA32_10240 [Fluviicola sp.]|nr:MAG: hypothetical protein COA32_10240 [Fluviicola sp.]
MNKSISPLKKRICKCGCEIEFQPRRKDQIYFDTIHANHGYNHGKRKERDPNSSTVIKHIRKNDSILRFFYEQKVGGEAKPRLSSLKDAGFNSAISVGNMEKDGRRYYFMYNYKYCFLSTENKEYVKIEKVK